MKHKHVASLLYNLVADEEVAPIKVGNGKWHGSVGGILCAPIDKVWTLVSKTKRLLEWMPMVERCSSLDGDDDEPGYVRLVLGFVFPQQDGERSWIKESLVSLDSSSHSGLSRISLQILLLFNSYMELFFMLFFSLKI
ncbi:hypothetical protein GmHk_19G055008 [Glycine max]|nr:hypothetical protein GmHk_19G055008 [Glycine max]